MISDVSFILLYIWFLAIIILLRIAKNSNQFSPPKPLSLTSSVFVSVDYFLLEARVKTKICTKCHEEKPINKFEKRKTGRDGYQTICSKCLYQRRINRAGYKQKNILLVTAWRERNPSYASDYYKKNKEYLNNYHKLWNKKYKSLYKRAHHKAQRFVKKYNIKKPDCQICGNKSLNVHMHHKNYDKPLEIVFLCKFCHARVHYGLLECPETINLMDLINVKFPSLPIGNIY